MTVGTTTVEALASGVTGTAAVTNVSAVTKPIPVLTYIGPATAAPGATITLSAWLHRGGLTALAGRIVTFSLNGTTLSATTNGFGTASVKTTAPASAGTYPIAVAFAGDATYAPASASATLKVAQPVPVLTYTGATNAKRGAPITLSAWLHVGLLAPVAGRTVTFTLNGTTLSATTNGFGIASVKTTAPASAGMYPISITFTGDTTYAAASVSATLRVR